MTAPYNRILLATERTEFDAGAERVGIELAAKCGQPLWVVMPLVSNPEYQIQAPERQEKAEAEASAKMDELEATASARGVEVHGMIRLGEVPFREIVDEAVVRKAELIVLRRRGKRSFLANLVFGEMVHTVISHTHCDVLTVPRAGQLWSKGVLLATDGSPNSERAITQSAVIAVRCGLPLTIVSVEDRKDGEGRGDSTAQANVDRALELARAAGAEATGRVIANGKPYQAILAAAEQSNCDLIVLGRRGLGRVKRLMVGSTSESVVGGAKGAVLVIQNSTEEHG